MSIIVAIVATYTFEWNIVRVDQNPHEHTLWGLIHSGVSVAFFGAGIFWDRRWLRWGQVGLFGIVAMTQLRFNDNPYLGFITLSVMLAVAYAYDLFDKHPIVKLIAGALVLFGGVMLVYVDVGKSLITFVGFLALVGLVGYILWDKVRRWKLAYRQMHSIASDSIALNEAQAKKRSQSAEHGN